MTTLLATSPDTIASRPIKGRGLPASSINSSVASPCSGTRAVCDTVISDSPPLSAGREMATFIQYASCYNNNRALQLLGIGRTSCLSIFSYPPCIAGPRSQLTYKGPDITMRHISQVIRRLRQLRARDVREMQISRAAKPSVQVLPAASSSSIQTKGKRCITCFRKRRNVKQVG